MLPASIGGMTIFTNWGRGEGLQPSSSLAASSAQTLVSQSFLSSEIRLLSTDSILLIGWPIESLLGAGVHVNAIDSRYILGGDQYPCWNLLPCNLGVAVLTLLIADSNCVRRVPNAIEE